jgi:hypothetical protein
MAIRWTKAADGVVAHAGPFVMKVAPKGDGRWNWSILRGDAVNPTASGIASSAGAAKTAAENFVNRSGLLP